VAQKFMSARLTFSLTFTPKTKKDPNHIFRIALSRYGGNAKIAIASGHQFGKWRFAGDARIVSEKEQSDSARKTPLFRLVEQGCNYAVFRR